jgi:hypothetical protein
LIFPGRKSRYHRDRAGSKVADVGRVGGIATVFGIAFAETLFFLQNLEKKWEFQI